MKHRLQLGGQQKGGIVQVGVVVARLDPLGRVGRPVHPVLVRVDAARSEHEGVVARRVGGLVALEEVRVLEEARELLGRGGDAHLLASIAAVAFMAGRRSK